MENFLKLVQKEKEKEKKLCMVGGRFVFFF